MAASRCYSTTAEDAGQRLDALLATRGLYASRSAAVRAIEEGRVFLNGATTTKKILVEPGQTIVYEMDEPKILTPLSGEAIPLDVRYEDDDLLVISKQPGLICHPTEDYREHTLVNALIHHCGAANLCNVQGEQDRLGIVHRLDSDTSGLMLAAKTDEAGAALMEAIAARAVDRRYKTLVHGIISQDTGLIDAPIARHPKDRLRMAVRQCESSRDALTSFKVLKRFEAGPKDNGYTLLECKLYTGRTHQIRVHMEYIAHPVVGDPIYKAHSPKAPLANLGLKRQFLHSWSLGFEHPVSGEPMAFEDDLPQDLQETLGKIEES